MTSDPSKNFGMSPDQFVALVQGLEAGDETIVELIFKRHFEVCRSYLVRKMGASHELAYDISKDTLLKFRANLLLGKIQYGNLAALFTIDARNTYLRRIERDKKYPVVGLDEPLLERAGLAEEEDTYDDALIDALKLALKKMNPDCYELLSWHYYLDMPYRAISEKRIRRGDTRFLSEDSVKTKMAECRKSLKKILTS